MLNVMVSYARKNSSWVYPLSLELQTNKWIVWIDKSNIEYASQWWNRILDAIEQKTFILAIISQDYLKSPFCRAELEYAIALNKPILIVNLDADYSTIPNEIKHLQIINQENANLSNPEKAIPAVLSGLTQLLSTIDEFKPNIAKRPPIPRRVGDLEKLPDWSSITTDYLEKHKNSDSSKVSLFFTGGQPSWDVILSDNVSATEKLEKVISGFETVISEDKCLVSIVGPSGEGKSTLLKQFAVHIAENEQDWTVFWCNKPTINTFPSFDLFGEKTILFIDEAFRFLDSRNSTIAPLKAFLDEVSSYINLNVVVVIACTDVDWRVSNSENTYTKISTHINISGIEKNDAKIITRNWYKTLSNAELPETLKNLSQERASSLFFDYATDEKRGSNTLIGALLSCWFDSKGILNHVSDLLNRLDSYQITSTGTLLNIFAYISVVDRLGIIDLLLTRNFLAYAFGLDVDRVYQKIEYPLGQEAIAASIGNNRVGTRHKLIAQAASKILKENYGQNQELELTNILKFIIKAFKNRVKIEDEIVINGFLMREWNNAPDTLLKKGMHEEALLVARALVKADPKDAKLVVKLAQILRRLKKSHEAVNELKERSETVSYVHYAYFNEWAVNEHIMGNKMNAFHLFTRSIADVKNPKDGLTENRVTISLDNLQKLASQLKLTNMSNITNLLKNDLSSGKFSRSNVQAFKQELLLITSDYLEEYPLDKMTFHNLETRKFGTDY